jgi:hypothetical protein
MPDYFRQIRYGSPTADYAFADSGFVPDAVVINLGTTDFGNGTMPDGFSANFTREYVAFLVNITRWYERPDITFFLANGPVTTDYLSATLAGVADAQQLGLKAHFLQQMGPPKGGCSGHPGVLGHLGMFELAQPAIASVMGWS